MVTYELNGNSVLTSDEKRILAKAKTQFNGYKKCDCIQIIIVMLSIIRYTKDIALLVTDIAKAKEAPERGRHAKNSEHWMKIGVCF